MCRCRMNNCMNNNNSNMIDVRMINNNMQDDDECECGFDEESVFLRTICLVKAMFLFKE